MNVVGRVGSLISQGVYSVATPFHPFGGVVDIIVVQQQDGTYRSTPWHVRFGKFQGVLKGTEKVVTIAVNGVEAGFHMYLDNSGEAYFTRDVAADSNTVELDHDVRVDKKEYDLQVVHTVKEEEDENAEHDFQNEKPSMEDQNELTEYCNYHYEGADSSGNAESEMVLVSVDGRILTAPISSNEHNTDNVQLTIPQFHLGPGEHSGEDFCAGGGSWAFGDLHVSEDNQKNNSGFQKDGGENAQVFLYDQVNGNTEHGVLVSCLVDDGLRKGDRFQSCLDFMLHSEDGNSQAEGSPTIHSELKTGSESSTSPSFVRIGMTDQTPFVEDSNASVNVSVMNDDLTCNNKLESSRIGLEISETTAVNDFRQNPEQHELDRPDANSYNSCSPEHSTTDMDMGVSENRTLYAEHAAADSGDFSVQSVSIDLEKKDVETLPTTTVECSENKNSSSQSVISGLGFEISLSGNLLYPGMGLKPAQEAFDAHCISEEEFKASGASIVQNKSLVVRYKERYFQWNKIAHVILGIVVYGTEFSVKFSDAIPVEHGEVENTHEDALAVASTSSRRWRLWPIPFTRAQSLQHSNSISSNEDLFVDSECGLPSPHVEVSPNDNYSSTQSPSKQVLRTKVPMNEQIASLNLKDGQNIVTFSFSTRVLGTQQVDAHIYLWKWNARVVISDVDGTITKSDVLGQFMPLVGKDWTQSGVAHLFSAIKENGYQLLFLSARAIVQAYLTRSFLLNLKQDGKTLPNGPIVISPDGLFPSLYREVVRRAPHEFKIACLEDIRALFPSDYNPFYAGFGNRDTDELSYRKMGIPKGKVFIINPKGEVAINHCIDVRSYTSLHTLVNDMFPPTSLIEQEDYNSWNYWKMPLPSISI